MFLCVVLEILRRKCNVKQSSSSSSPSSSTVAARRRTKIINAGSGAGNLAIPLAACLLDSMEEEEEEEEEEGSFDFDKIEILAINTNEFALKRLFERAGTMPIVGKHMQMLVANLANVDLILGHIPTENDVVVVLLHACGAALDYMMNLAHARDAPFAVCPCCTAKSLTKRGNSSTPDSIQSNNTSFQQRGATKEITYSCSKWLNGVLNLNNAKAEYAILAKVANVGLDPQTPSQQCGHQRRAKHIIKLDWLVYSSSREYGYKMGLVRVWCHDPIVCGKGGVLLGVKGGSVAAGVFGDLLLE